VCFVRGAFMRGPSAKVFVAGSKISIVELRLLDAREWSRLEAKAGAARPQIEGITGIGDQAFVSSRNRGRL
jgi:hypothetical protein